MNVEQRVHPSTHAEGRHGGQSLMDAGLQSRVRVAAIEVDVGAPAANERPFGAYRGILAAANALDVDHVP